jgi:glycerophosphoryl diester phosphodiesterase
MAHRGLHLNGIPENSLDAYRYAARCGFDYAETDFQVTSDGELVLMHNESINATMRNAADYSEITGTINVSEKTLADLRENYVLASSDVRMRKPIPTLEEYFITCRNSGIFPVPEIKAFGMSNEQIKKAHDLGCAIMGEGNFGFCSFSAEYLDYARTLSEKTILCYIMSGGIVGTNNSITGNSRVSPTTWWYPTWDSQNYGDYGVTLENVRRHKEAGVKVAVWTTPVSQFDNLLKKEIDCISTDDICPSIDGLVGKVATSDNGFSDFETTGYESNGKLILSAGQTCRFNAGDMWLGGYYLSIIGKGNFTISAPNLNVTISNSKTDRYIYQGLVNNQIGELTITANGSTELEFVEFSCVEL